jgi:hypothetical protein
MGFQRLLHTETGRIFISIVLGLGIASLFRKVCKDRSCIAFRAPPLKDLEKDVYKLDDKCYTYKTKAVKCDSAKKDVLLN